MLRECVSSIFALSLNDDEREVIIVDDGSTASFDEALRGFDNKITLIRQKYQGPSVARNVGLSVATGDYIQFVDSDDTLITEVYERVIRKVREKQMDMLMFRFTYGSAKPKDKKISRCYDGCQFLLNKNLRAAVWGYIFRRDVIGDLCFHPGIYHEDALFTPQLIMRVKSLYVLKEKAYFYRQSDGTIMSSRDEQHIQKRLNDSIFVLLELKKQADRMKGYHRKAMLRCIDQQTMCFIYTMITLRRPRKDIINRLSVLRENHLYPLPIRCYTWKYLLFALLTKIVA